jgi:hypothetical protein
VSVMIRFPMIPHHQYVIIQVAIAHVLIALEVLTFNVLHVVQTIKDTLLVVLAHALTDFIIMEMLCVNRVIFHVPNVQLQKRV